ncbi:DUF485 domain-containing protein [Streptomyces pathocidini]|uniref:DUF485 domain-containing protein n=1 Tax=Streptomyces pathocidini TaxID=1650571 RepID=UPI0033C4757E
MEQHDGREAGTIRLDDPWYDVIAPEWGDTVDETGPPEAPPPAPQQSTADIYLEVQRSAAFQKVRRTYRRFVLPASAVFLAWFFAYVITATVAPGLMARSVAGALNVAMLAGLGQFATTFLLTWAYARHARLRRDREALDLRWETQDMTRTKVLVTSGEQR